MPTYRPYAIGIIEPSLGPFDGGERPEPVLDEGKPERVFKRVRLAPLPQVPSFISQRMRCAFTCAKALMSHNIGSSSRDGFRLPDAAMSR